MKWQEFLPSADGKNFAISNGKHFSYDRKNLFSSFIWILSVNELFEQYFEILLYIGAALCFMYQTGKKGLCIIVLINGDKLVKITRPLQLFCIFLNISLRFDSDSGVSTA